MKFDFLFDVVFIVVIVRGVGDLMVNLNVGFLCGVGFFVFDGMNWKNF